MLSPKTTTISASRFLLVALLAAGGLLLLVSQVSSQNPRTLDVDVVFAFESFEIAPALGNPIPTQFPGRGDVFSGQGAVYAAGDRTNRIGTFYFMGVGTAEPEHVQAAANHAYAMGYFELFGEGTLAVTGVVSFFQGGSAAITGGTGVYAMASGQCFVQPSEDFDHWTCEIH